MSEALVLRHDAGGICTLTLNRPAQRNAINRELFREFRAHIRDIEADGSEVGLIVVTGVGWLNECASLMRCLTMPPSAESRASSRRRCRR